MKKPSMTLEYEGNNSTLIWKHPFENLKIDTQIVVRDSMEAIIVRDGIASSPLTAGRHEVFPQNPSFFKRVFNIGASKEETVHGEVYFINKVLQMGIRWGTDSKVEYLEPTYHLPVQIGANGDLNIRVTDSKKLLTKILGTESSITQQKMMQFLRGILIMNVKTHMANLMKANTINIFEIDAHLPEFANLLLERLRQDFREYGIELERFTVMQVLKPEADEQFIRMKKLYAERYMGVAEESVKQQIELIRHETEERKKLMESETRAASRAQEGYTYQEERRLDIEEIRASMPDTTQTQKIDIDVDINKSVNEAIRLAQESPKAEPPVEPAETVDPLAAFNLKLDQLAAMRSKGIISEEEFNETKKQLLDSIR